MKYVTSIQDSQGLSVERIRAQFPSVLSETAKPDRSSKYLLIPTIDIINALAVEGFAITQVMCARSRTAEGLPFVKHLLNFRLESLLGTYQPEVTEIVLKNSHDGSSSYELMMGVFRIICANGMIAFDERHPNYTMRVKHLGNALPEIVEGSIRITEESAEVMKNIAEMKSVQLSRPEQLLLAEQAVSLRFPDYTTKTPEGEVKTVSTIFKPEDLLTIHRNEDLDASLWTTHNVIQENALKGGPQRKDAKGHRRRIMSINGIDQNTALNQALWALSQKMLELKTA